MLKFHPSSAFMKTYTNFKKKFGLGFLVKIFFFQIKFKIPILDKNKFFNVIAKKTVFHLKGYITVAFVVCMQLLTYCTLIMTSRESKLYLFFNIFKRRRGDN